MKWRSDSENYQHHLIDNLRQGGKLELDASEALRTAIGNADRMNFIETRVRLPLE